MVEVVSPAEPALVFPLRHCCSCSHPSRPACPHRDGSVSPESGLSHFIALHSRVCLISDSLIPPTAIRTDAQRVTTRLVAACNDWPSSRRGSPLACISRLHRDLPCPCLRPSQERERVTTTSSTRPAAARPPLTTAAPPSIVSSATAPSSCLTSLACPLLPGLLSRTCNLLQLVHHHLSLSGSKVVSGSPPPVHSRLHCLLQPATKYGPSRARSPHPTPSLRHLPSTQQ